MVYFAPLVILGTETSNKYEIKNSLGQRIYFAVEESICFNRTFCSTLRSCTLRITDNSGREVITVNRPLRCNSCWCPCYLQEVSYWLWLPFLIFKISICFFKRNSFGAMRQLTCQLFQLLIVCCSFRIRSAWGFGDSLNFFSFPTKNYGGFRDVNCWGQLMHHVNEIDLWNLYSSHVIVMSTGSTIGHICPLSSPTGAKSRKC